MLVDAPGAHQPWNEDDRQSGHENSSSACALEEMAVIRPE
jgi:hypothetical protein